MSSSETTERRRTDVDAAITARLKKPHAQVQPHRVVAPARVGDRMRVSVRPSQGPSGADDSQGPKVRSPCRSGAIRVTITFLRTTHS